MEIDELARAISERRAILFVGAGVSSCLGLPSFQELVDHIAHELGYDPEVYRSFGDVYQLTEFYMTQQGDLGPLRSWMDVSWHKSSTDITKSKVHDLILALDFPVIYTTNYDRWLEKSYDAKGRAYTKIVHVADFAKIKDGNTQIIKFHGDFSSDESIVLSETSYFDRLSFESPLDVRLRSDVLGKTVLFLGYSLADINIRYLIYRLSQQWATAARIMNVRVEARPKSYISLLRPNPIQEAVLQSRGITPLVLAEKNPVQATEDFLEALLAKVGAIAKK